MIYFGSSVAFGKMRAYRDAVVAVGKMGKMRNTSAGLNVQFGGYFKWVSMDRVISYN